MTFQGLFHDINFIADLKDDRIAQLLTGGGASQYQSLAATPGPCSIHLITEDYNSPVSLAARAPPYSNRVVICTPAWVETSHTRGKLQDVRRYSPDPRQFFTGVCVTCSELPTGDKEAIYGGVLALGGHYSDALVKGTTHIVTLTMNSDKVREAVEHPRRGVEIVLPHWFDDCLRLRRRIPSDPYRFPHPRILQTNFTDGAPTPVSQESNFQHLCESRAAAAEAPESTEDIFRGKTVYLGNDLDLGERLSKTLSAVLGGANAILARSIEKADMYIGKYRDGQQYLTAAKCNKIIGNYTWIIYCLARGKYSSPRDHLLHYPVARTGLWEFRNDIITVSNYTGEPRLYLERLITALGAQFTRNMKPENTHLITAAECGEKYNTAKQWGISCVNHLWLEESYAKWQKQALTLHHYVAFPKETNLMDVIAQTPVLSEGLEPFLVENDTEDEIEPISQPRAEALSPGAIEEKAVEDKSITRPDLQEESQDLELPDIKDIREFSSPLPPLQKSSGMARDDLNSSGLSKQVSGASLNGEEETTPRATAQSTPKTHSRETLHEPRLATPSDAQLQTPSSRGSTARKASQAAASKLRDNMEDANKFGQQMRNKHKLPPLPSEMHLSKKTKLSDNSDVLTKKTIKVVMTGCPEFTETLQTAAEALGIEFEEDPKGATHLIAPRVARTKKFVVAIPHCSHFVNWEWLLDSIKAQKPVSEAPYPIADPPVAPWSRDLVFDKVLERAALLKRKGGLLQGFVILISEAVTKIGGFETYRDIVEANGGTCGMIGRRGVNTTEGRAVMIVDGKSDVAVGKHLASFKSGAKGKENKDAKQAVKYEIYDREWLMICAIRQELLFDDKLRIA